MRGELSETSAADLCRRLADAGATGAVDVEHPRGRARIYFDAGHIYWADSPAPRARLGDRLVHAALLTEEQLEEALTEQARADSPPKLGTLLVERGLVSHDVIRIFVQEQILDALFEVMGWHEGDFRFSSGETVDEDLPVDLPVDEALVEVARRQQEWTQIRRTIPGLEAVPDFVPGASSASAALEPDEFAVLASVDGQRSIHELAVDLGYGEFEAARIVYGLVLLGVIEIVGSGAGPLAASTAPSTGETGTSDAQEQSEAAAGGSPRPQVRVHRDLERWERPAGRRADPAADDEGSADDPEADAFEEPEPVVFGGDADAAGPAPDVEEVPAGADLDDAEFDRLLDELAGTAPDSGSRRAHAGDPSDHAEEVGSGAGPAASEAPPSSGDETHRSPPPPEAEPPDRETASARRRADGRDADVSEFLRELSRLALDDEGDVARPPEPEPEPDPARSAADAAAKERSERPPPGEREDRDDRKKRGLFGWGR